MKLSPARKTRLQKALRITRPHKETAEGIVARMELLLDEFHRTPELRGFAPFLHTYLLITKAVVRDKRSFNHPEDLDRLDAHFASLYFRPLERFLFSGRPTRPWAAYYRYCSDPTGSAFVQMLLGINAHINGDLGRTICKTSYRHRADFLRINTILEDEIPRVLKYLAFEQKDPVAMGGLLWKQFIRRQFTKTVVEWRNDAWAGAHAMDKGRLTPSSVCRDTEKISEALIDTFADLYRLRRVTTHLKRLEELRLTI